MATKRTTLLATLFCLLFLTLTADAATIPLRGRWEHSFRATKAATPETELYVELTSPSGKVVLVPGFWDGDTTWRVRFMPNEEGSWHYRTRSDPIVDGLDGERGTFVCRQGTQDTAFLLHGAVHVSARGPFFEHSDGTPVVAPRNGVGADEKGEISFIAGHEHIGVPSRLDRL